MKILITGGAGFIGANLCRRLLADGHDVICLDNLYTGRRENIAELELNPHFSFVLHDVTEPIPFTFPKTKQNATSRASEASRETSSDRDFSARSPGSFGRNDAKGDGMLDRIYHLACPASPPHYQRDPIKTLLTSVLGTKHALDLAKRTGARILFSSTSEVYGDPLEHPQTESYRGNVNCDGPRSCYDEGKRAAETLCMDYHRGHGVDIRIIRIFNTYGPFMDPNDGRVVSNLIVQALQEKPLTIYGDGSQTRSFQYIDDLIEGMTRMMENDKNFIGPVNLGNPDEFTVRELADFILGYVKGSDPLPRQGQTPLPTNHLINFLPLPTDDPRQRKPDITLAQTTLGWSPNFPLARGLPRTIAYFASAIKTNDPHGFQATQESHLVASLPRREKTAAMYVERSHGSCAGDQAPPSL